MIALLLALLAALPEATPLAIDVQVAPEEVTLGEHVAVKIAIDHDPRDVYSLPGFDAAPLQILAPAKVHREELPPKAARTVFELTLADYGTVEPRIPDLKFHVTGPDGERELNVRGRPLKFRSLVEEEHAPSPDQAHHGPKPPVPVLVRSLLWLWLLLGLLAIGALLALRKYLTRRKLLPQAQELPKVEADDLALQQLQALQADAPWKHGDGRPAIFRLSEIVRGYLGARLEFNALDLTTAEFLEILHKRRLMGLDLAELEEEVRWEDLVKFAKVEPTAEECLRGIRRAESMVRHTRPLRALSPGAAA
ncbi:MAG: hypothetical protein ACXWLM_08495 [Myxococcales bacterium]